MWWIRDLFFRPAVRVGLVVLATLAVGYVAYGVVTGDEAPGEAGTPSSIDAPAGSSSAPSAKRCIAALEELDALVEQVPNVADVGVDDRSSFVASLSAARASCSYREYADYEVERLLPWTKNVSVEEMFGEQLAQVGS